VGEGGGLSGGAGGAGGGGLTPPGGCGGAGGGGWGGCGFGGGGGRGGGEGSTTASVVVQSYQGPPLSPAVPTTSAQGRERVAGAGGGVKKKVMDVCASGHCSPRVELWPRPPLEQKPPSEEDGAGLPVVRCARQHVSLWRRRGTLNSPPLVRAPSVPLAGVRS